MSTTDRRGLAFQLVAVLECYEGRVRSLAESWLDADVYHDANRTLEEVRNRAAAFPALSVASVALFLSHSELVHVLWTESSDPACDRHLGQVMQQHQRCVDHLRKGAAEIFRV